jgi:hypothetical protein
MEGSSLNHQKAERQSSAGPASWTRNLETPYCRPGPPQWLGRPGSSVNLWRASDAGSASASPRHPCRGATPGPGGRSKPQATLVRTLVPSGYTSAPASPRCDHPGTAPARDLDGPIGCRQAGWSRGSVPRWDAGPQRSPCGRPRSRGLPAPQSSCPTGQPGPAFISGCRGAAPALREWPPHSRLRREPAPRSWPK